MGLILTDWYFSGTCSALETCNCLVTRGRLENMNAIIRDVHYTHY